MTAGPGTELPPPPPTGPSGPPQDEVAAVRPRRDLRLVLLGVALAVVCALLAVWAVNRAGEARQVVVVKQDIRAGDRVEASDLGTTQLRGGDEVNTVRARDLNSLVGKRAVQPMAAGSLVTHDDFAQRITPRAGDVIVPISVVSGQYPASGLQRGDVVRVIVTGNLVSRSWEDKETGQKRSVMEMQVDEVGPSLRYATAKVTKTQRGGGGGQGGGSWGGGGQGGSGGGFGGQQDDPWATGGGQGGGQQGGGSWGGGQQAPAQGAPQGGGQAGGGWGNAPSYDEPPF